MVVLRNLNCVLNKLLGTVRHLLGCIKFNCNWILLSGWHSTHVTVLHMVHWLIHLHKLVASWDYLRKLLISILRLRSSIILPHLLIQEIWIHKHLLAWECHLIRHHHISRKLVHLIHINIHRWRHALGSWHLSSVISIGSFIIQIFPLGVLSKLSFAMCIRTFPLIFTMTI